MRIAREEIFGPVRYLACAGGGQVLADVGTSDFANAPLWLRDDGRRQPYH
jgi:hypothetical protein